MDKMLKARTRLIMNQPFFGVLALQLDLVEESDPAKVDTMATDGRRLFYNPAYVEGLSIAEVQGVIAHEVLHVAALHFARRGERDKRLWNVACDYAINGDVIAAGMTLPGDVLLRADFAGMNAEAIYAELLREQEQGKDDPVPNGYGAGGPGQILDAGAPNDAAVEALVNEVRATVLTTAASVVRQAGGDVPTWLKRVIEGARASTGNDWRAVLREFINSARQSDYTWMRPNRRFIGQGVYFPGTENDAIEEIAVIVDTSGSMSSRELGLFTREIQAALDAVAINRVQVIYTDTQVRGTQIYEAGDEIVLKPVGGGGTMFDAVMQVLPDLAPDASMVIFLTDMATTSFGTDPGVPVVWVRVGTYDVTPPFGTVVQLVE